MWTCLVANTSTHEQTTAAPTPRGICSACGPDHKQNQPAAPAQPTPAQRPPGPLALALATTKTESRENEEANTMNQETESASLVGATPPLALLTLQPTQ